MAKFEVPPGIARTIGSKVNTREAFTKSANALVALERIRKMMKIEFDAGIKPAYQDYKALTDEKKESDSDLAEASAALREQLADYLTREEEESDDWSDSIRFDLPDGLRLMNKDVVVVHDMQELVEAVAQGRVDISVLQPDIKQLQKEILQMGGIVTTPGVALEKTKEWRVGGKKKETEE